LRGWSTAFSPTASGCFPTACSTTRCGGGPRRSSAARSPTCTGQESETEGSTMDRYLVISSDTHAGPPSEAYRDHVDPQYREAFDKDQENALALRSLILDSASQEQTKFREEWEEV